jgi:RNA recognition motif-containing protein
MLSGKPDQTVGYHIFSKEKKGKRMNIYVGNLPFEATEDEIRAMFAAFGQVASVALITDKFTNKPRGFGFVEMPNVAEAQKAIQALNGTELKGRALAINPAKPREEGGGNRGGGRGGPGGGRRYGGDRRHDRPGGSGGGQKRGDW